VTDVERLSTASSAAPGPTVRFARILRVLAPLLIIVPAITLPVVLPASAVAADQISTLQAQATQLAHNLVLEQLQIGADQVQYQSDTQQVAADDARITQTQSTIAADQEQVRSDVAVLDHDAILALTGGSSANARVLRMFDANQGQSLARDEYEQIAASTTLGALDRLHTAQDRLRSERTVLLSQERQASAAQQQAGAELTSAQTTAETLQSQQASITGQLAQAVAAQQAAIAAAAQRAAQQQAQAQQAAQARQAALAAYAAQQARQQQASQQQANATPAPPQVSTTPVTSTTSQASAPPASTGSSAGLPPIMQCILQAESGGDYSIVSANGQYMGGFQFSQAAWDEAAQLAGQPQLVGVAPNTASPAVQNELALALYAAAGDRPWVDPCTGG